MPIKPLARNRKQGRLSALMPNFLLILTVGYIVTYDFLPRATLVFGAVLPVAVLTTVALDYAANLAKDQLKAIIYIAGLGACSVVLQFSGYHMNWIAWQRYILALTCLCIAFFVRGNTIHKSLPICGTSIIVFAGAIGISGAPVIYAASSRFAPFTGGDNAVHSSALAVTAAVIAILASKAFKSWWGLIALVGVAEVIGYGTAGEFISCIIAIVGFSYLQGAISRRIPVKRIAILATPFIVYVILWKESLSATVGGSNGTATIGSGRVGAWQERLNIALDRGWAFNLLGTGPHSDLRLTAVWWWEAKGAHSDLVTLFMEFGLLGLMMAVLLIVLLARSVSARGKIALASALVGALISNALLDRPVQALFFGLAIASTTELPRARGRTLDSTKSVLSPDLVMGHEIVEKTVAPKQGGSSSEQTANICPQTSFRCAH